MSEIVEHIKQEIGKNIKSVENKICHPLTSLVLDCFYRELFKVCPKIKFSNNIPDCMLLKNYASTCDDW